MCPTEADKKSVYAFCRLSKNTNVSSSLKTKQCVLRPPPLESGWGAALADGNMTESFTLPARQSAAIEHQFPQLNKKRTTTTILSEVRMKRSLTRPVMLHFSYISTVNEDCRFSFAFELKPGLSEATFPFTQRICASITEYYNHVSLSFICTQQSDSLFSFSAQIIILYWMVQLSFAHWITVTSSDLPTIF